MTFDTIVANPGRLTILTALAVEPQQEFVSLRNRTNLTDGNLSSHARRLASAGMVEIDKQLREGKPVTTLKLTSTGRAALESHVRRLVTALSYKRVGVSEPVVAQAVTTATATLAKSRNVRVEEEWVD